MWDFKIGEGDSGCSSTIIPKYKSISENNVSYWITTDMDFSFVIMKNTEEGKQIKNCIDEKINPILVEEKLIKIALKYIPIMVFMKWYGNILEEAYERGEESAKEEIRRYLGINK